MKASLDTNVIIHLYRAGLQNILFDLFDKGVFIYEQIRDIELENHGQDVLADVDEDIAARRIILYTDERLRRESVFRIFEYHVRDNKKLYSPSDLGEVYAISLAQTLGAFSLITDDIKQGGPYMSLLQLEYDVMPFTFADILILRYLLGTVDEIQTVNDFDAINRASELEWTFRRQVAKFIRRFWDDPYKVEDEMWMQRLVEDNNIRVRSKFINLCRLI